MPSSMPLERHGIRDGRFSFRDAEKRTKTVRDDQCGVRLYVNESSVASRAIACIASLGAASRSSPSFCSDAKRKFRKGRVTPLPSGAGFRPGGNGKKILAVRFSATRCARSGVFLCCKLPFALNSAVFRRLLVATSAACNCQ